MSRWTGTSGAVSDGRKSQEEHKLQPKQFGAAAPKKTAHIPRYKAAKAAGKESGREEIRFGRDVEPDRCNSDLCQQFGK
jgi:hypothetical protein